MHAVIGLIIGLLAFLRVLPALRAFWRGMRRVLMTAPLIVLAVLISLPMVLQPGDVSRAWQPWSPLELDQPMNVVARWKVRAMLVDGGLCRRALGRSAASVAFLDDAVDSTNCHIRNRVRLSGVATARLAPVETRCEIAARLYLWEREVLQPAARRHLGTGVRRIEHFSSYSCRKMRTSRGGSGRWSQHATANALDIAGFVLSDGRRISLLKDWDGGGTKAAFLREARDGLCDWFNVVLSPDYNSLHADHFHADMGPFLSCR